MERSDIKKIVVTFDKTDRVTIFTYRGTVKTAKIGDIKLYDDYMLIDNSVAAYFNQIMFIEYLGK